jgi:hypothetical protein
MADTGAFLSAYSALLADPNDAVLRRRFKHAASTILNSGMPLPNDMAYQLLFVQSKLTPPCSQPSPLCVFLNVAGVPGKAPVVIDRYLKVVAIGGQWWRLSDARATMPKPLWTCLEPYLSTEVFPMECVSSWMRVMNSANSRREDVWRVALEVGAERPCARTLFAQCIARWACRRYHWPHRLWFLMASGAMKPQTLLRACLRERGKPQVQAVALLAGSPFCSGPIVTARAQVLMWPCHEGPPHRHMLDAWPLTRYCAFCQSNVAPHAELGWNHGWSRQRAAWAATQAMVQC